MPDLFSPSVSGTDEGRGGNTGGNGKGNVGGGGIGGGLEHEEREKMRKADLQERIRRGRECGWVRKRFEGGRYRELCERAVGEIEGGMF